MAQDAIAEADQPTHLQMWRSFLEAHSTVVKHLERRMQEQHGLPLAWWDVLIQLASNAGMLGGGGGGGVPMSTSMTHLPRSTGDVRADIEVKSSTLPWPSPTR